MRIITGEYKGRRLETPENYDIRPTADKVKEALFSMIAFEIEDAVCVDLFAGTGSLGLEALSRGALRCYFCDNAREAARIIRMNVAHVGAEEKSVVLSGDFRKGLGRIKEKADFIFLDPPYEGGLYEKAFHAIAEAQLLAAGGTIIAESRSDKNLPEEIAGFVKVKERKYGRTLLSVYNRAEDADGREA